MSQIMIVDDVVSIRQIVSTLLGNAGHRVIEASSGEEALGIAQSQHIHLVLTDINMSGMTSLELISKLREIYSYRTTPIIVLAKGSNDENIRKAKLLGANGWIKKPFNPERLFNSIDQIIVDHYGESNPS